MPGRALGDIDAMFGPGIAVAAEHGAMLRDAAGDIIRKGTEDAHSQPEGAAARGCCRHAWYFAGGKMLRAGAALARRLPGFAESLTALAIALAAPHPGLLLQPAHEALEIRVRGPSKAGALEIFMRAPPLRAGCRCSWGMT